MPRNLDKTRCTIPGCRNWAMRDHTYCRPHRNNEFREASSHSITQYPDYGGTPKDEVRQRREGARGSGAPPGNLNALKTGAYANPLPPSELEDLVATVVADPDDFVNRICLAVRAVQDRTGDTFLTLVALRRLLTQLVPLVAARLFIAELYAYLRRSSLSPLECHRQVREIARLAAGKNLEARLWALRKKSGSG